MKKHGLDLSKSFERAGISIASVFDPKTPKVAINSIASLEDKLSRLETKYKRQEIGSAAFNRLSASIKETKKQLEDANKATQDLEKTTGGLKAAFTMAFSGVTAGALISSVRSVMDEAEKAKNTMRGLAAVTQFQFGKEAVPDAIDSVRKLSSELNLNKDSIAAAYKNFISMGYSVEQSTKLIKAHADVGSVSRQSNYSLAESIDVASQGYKNQNSVLSDATGIQTNISKMLDKHGMKMDDLSSATTKAAALQALYNETLKEAEAFQGKAAEAAAGYAGSMGVLEKNSAETRVALGNLFQESLLPMINLAGKGTGFLSGFLSGSERATELKKQLSDLGDQIKKVPQGTEEWKKLDNQIKKTESELEKLGPTAGHVSKSLIVAGTSGLTLYSSLVTITKGLEMAGVAGAANWTKILGPLALGVTAMAFVIDVSYRMSKEENEKFGKDEAKAYADKSAAEIRNAYENLELIANLTTAHEAINEETYKSQINLLKAYGVEVDKLYGKMERAAPDGKDLFGLKVDKAKALVSELKELEKQNLNKPTSPKISEGGSGKLKQDLSEQKRLIEEFWKANPSTVKIVASIQSQSFEYLIKQLRDFSQRAGAKIPLELDGKEISIDEIKDKDQLERVVNALSEKYQIHPDVVLKLKPDNLDELDELILGYKTEIERKIKSGKFNPKEELKLKAELDDAKTFDKMTAGISKGRSELEQLTGPLTQTESQIFEIAQQINVATNRSETFAESFSAWGKVGLSVVSQLGSAYVQVAQAQAQVAQVHSQNQIQQIQFQAQVAERILDAQLQAFLLAKDAELAKLQETLDAMAQAEQEYEADKQARRDAEAEKIRQHNDELYNEDAKRLEEQYNLKYIQLEKEHGDDIDFESRKKELFAQLQLEKDELRKRYNDKTTADINKSEKDQNAKDEKKKKEDEKNQKAIAEEQKRIEAEKAAATAKTETDKQNAKRLSALIEWQAGKTAFEANKKAQVAQAAFGMAQAAIQGAITFASMVAGYTAAGAALAPSTLGVSIFTMPAIGVAAGAALGGVVAGAGVAAGTMALSAAQSQQYPPFMAFSGGGLVQGGIPGKDSVPALLMPQETVVPEKGWSSLESQIADRLTQNVTNRSGDIHLTWAPSYTGGNIPDFQQQYAVFKNWFLTDLKEAGVLG
ncbi:primosomal protein [Leptospira interrogans]|uniref:primosomal protein n=1 Tax=Leptospira interrogans TaxID=173 RepID=UPI001F0860C3|nr:primosomal protein [Leptospira interrogans]